ncbi:hypothetical protein LCGC14_3096570 [marine sediment metagenome]|uniref:Uncharacterized protein n=1 Tax=marine sediment metagenome TaxID=412755 RepID=A0A0F8WXT0_9ZZZZ
MKEIIYHSEHKGGHPTRTVCLLVDEQSGPIARGEAKRSLKDNFNRKRGKTIAVGRAKKALATGTTVFDEGALFFKRTYFPITLTPYEHELVEGLKKARVIALEGGN